MKRTTTTILAILTVATLTASAQQAQTTQTFGGSRQYRTWSVGANAGILAPVVFTGGSNDFTNWNGDLGYGLTLKKQLGHTVALSANVLRGDVSGSNEDAALGIKDGLREFKTEIGYAADVRGEITLGTISFLKRANSLVFTTNAGFGLMGYAPAVTDAASRITDYKGKAGDDGNNTYVKELYMPLGVGARFKVSEMVSFNVAYTMNYMDGDNLDGIYKGGKDKFSYGSAGLEFMLGSKTKPALVWNNPVAVFYDELKDPSLRKDVEELQQRVDAIDADIEKLTRDSDGDGVSDEFDKCPGTPAGTKVDGSGCPIIIPQKKK